MKRTGKAGEKRRITVVLAFLLLAVPALSLSPTPAGEPPQRPPALSFEPASLPEVWRDLGRLRGAELRDRADQLFELEPKLTLRAMMLRAGREIPPTVSATRREERIADRETALEWLRRHLDTDPEARAWWEETARELLILGAPRALAAATAGAVGALREYGLADELALGLDSKVPEVRHASSRALFTLYLQWFPDLAAFEALHPSAREFCDQALYEVALEFERTARERGIKLLRYEPHRAPAVLDDPDPRMRAAAATVLGRAGNGGASDAIERLLEHLGREVDAGAYLATIEALLQTQAAAAPEAPNLRRLRAALQRTLEDDVHGLQAPAAQALARLPWSEDAGSEDGLLVGVNLLVDQLRGLTVAERLTDGDVLIASLKALQVLCGRAGSLGLPIDGQRDDLRATVARLIEDEMEVEGVRVAAAQLLPAVGTTADLSRAVAVLDAPGSSAEFRYTLLGVLGDMSLGLSSEDAAARLVLETMLRRLGGDDSNLRRRALAFLADERFEALTSTADPAAFVDSLGRETVPDLQEQLLDLIARRGGRDEIDGLIALPNFDAIANGGPAGISGLVQALRELGVGDADLTLRGAVRLLAVDNDGTRVLRLREVLGLVGDMDQEAAASLPPSLDAAIVRWSTELRQAAGSVPGGEGFLRRLVEVHVPGGVGAEEISATELAHMKALFLSDWIALDPAAGEVSAVLTGFGEALDIAERDGDLRRRALILRDRARILLARGDRDGALADYRALFGTEAGEEGGGADSVLQLVDLRKGSELLFSRAEGDGAAALAEEALRVSLALVSRPTWKREPAAVRAQDLADLASRAARSGAVEAIDLALPFFEGLPELPPAPAEGEEPPPPGPTPEGAPWAGLLESREVHERLLELRAELVSQRQAIAAGAPAGGEATSPVEPPEEDAGTGEGDGDGEGPPDGGSAGDPPPDEDPPDGAGGGASYPQE